ncbi:MAG: hypothetical protein JXA33_22945, partial [Anaerolineae bacterium]|nr:hypothetical protein [Anaerolineae bacterium]
MSDFTHARALLKTFKGNTYLFGNGVLPQVGDVTAELGTRAALVRGTFPGSDDDVATIRRSCGAAGVTLV